MIHQEGKARFYWDFDISYKNADSEAGRFIIQHLAMFPNELDIQQDEIYNNFNKDFVVMDCFMGSGTTAVAAKELGVHFIGYELNERFWNIANERLQGISKIEKQAKEDGLIPLF